MAKVLIEETTLTAIGDAIRGKENSTDLVPVNDMATRISAIQSGGDELPEEAFNYTDSIEYVHWKNHHWLFDKYKDRMTFTNVTKANNAFGYSNLEELPFTVYFKDNIYDFSQFIYANSYLKVAPKLRGNFRLDNLLTFSNACAFCYCMRDFDDMLDPEALEGLKDFKLTSAYSCFRAPSFQYCYSLRHLPAWWYKFRFSPDSTYALNSNSYTVYNSTFQYCYALDAINNLQVVYSRNAATTSNIFSTSTFRNTYRLAGLTFEQVDDPVKWKSQIIDLSTYVGYSSAAYMLTTYNAGITADKEVKDDATYQALKNDPDWFTAKIEYSRYNHDSAVETINSLPDTSEYIASAGGTNTIKFKGASGSATDGGAINTLTAEEIAVAAAKGWTVTLA